MTVALLASTPLLAALVWVAALVVEPGPLAPMSLLLVAIGLLATATVGMVGITLIGARWAHRLSVAAVAATFHLAVLRPIDAFWWAGLAMGLIAAVSLFSPTLIAGIRRLPAAAGPPWRAVLIPLLLIGFPFVIGVAAGDSPTVATAIVGLTAPVAALWFSRVLPGGLVAVRALWPALAALLAIFQPLLPAAAGILGAAVIASLAWHSSVKVAFHPPRERGTVVPIPPELAPGEVLDAARLDDQGRPLR